MSPGRPPLRIGDHGKITRKQFEVDHVPVPGVWIARCRYRDTDGVTRIVERKSPNPGKDQWGKKAVDALLEALVNRQAPGGGDVNEATKVIDLIKTHIERNDQWAGRTIDTYNYTTEKLSKFIGGLRVKDATPPRIDAALRSMKTAHGAGMARHARVLFLGALDLAVMSSVLRTNPVRDVRRPPAAPKAKGAKPVETARINELLEKLQASEFCHRKDLVDPIRLFIATGLRRSELLGLRWSDYSPETGIVTVTGKLVRVNGQGLKRVNKTKSESGERDNLLPPNVQEMLAARRVNTDRYGASVPMIFPSTAGTWRDPDNFNGDWRKARTELGFPDITSHSFRKALATAIDEQGLSARVGADQLGHSNVSMTQDTYMARKKLHPEVAAFMEELMTGVKSQPKDVAAEK
jgi:integrase